MDIVDTLILLIKTALCSKTERNRAINELQQIIWNQENEISDISIKQIFSDLAYDLEYYEPNAIKRQEDPSYYDDAQLEDELINVLNKLRQTGIIVDTKNKD